MRTLTLYKVAEEGIIGSASTIDGKHYEFKRNGGGVSDYYAYSGDGTSFSFTKVPGGDSMPGFFKPHSGSFNGSQMNIYDIEGNYIAYGI